MPPRPLDHLWSSRLGVPVEAVATPMPRAVLVGPAARSEVVAFRRGDAWIVAVPAQRLEIARATLAERCAVDSATVATLGGAPESAVVGPAYQGVWDHDTARRRNDRKAKTAEVMDRDDERVQRLATLYPTDWRNSGFDHSDSPQFAITNGDRVVAMAHYSLWAPDVASIGVLVAPEARGSGLGSAVVEAAIRHGFSQGFDVCYQTLSANTASTRLAIRVGFIEYATTLRVNLDGCGETSGVSFPAGSETGGFEADRPAFRMAACRHRTDSSM